MASQITYCTTCSNLSALIAEIDCSLQLFAHNKWNNLRFGINLPYNKEIIGDLIFYKKLLYRKIRNSEYLCYYSIETISSRVIDLLNKQ